MKFETIYALVKNNTQDKSKIKTIELIISELDFILSYDQINQLMRLFMFDESKISALNIIMNRRIKYMKEVEGANINNQKVKNKDVQENKNISNRNYMGLQHTWNITSLLNLFTYGTSKIKVLEILATTRCIAELSLSLMGSM